jgi:hypothetical protein
MPAQLLDQLLTPDILVFGVVEHMQLHERTGDLFSELTHRYRLPLSKIDIAQARAQPPMTRCAQRSE